MKKIVFSIYDKKAGFFGPLMDYMKKGEVLRMFSDMVNEKARPSMVAKHPEDYELYQLGSYENVEGKVEGSNKVYIACGSDFIQTQVEKEK